MEHGGKTPVAMPLFYRQQLPLIVKVSLNQSLFVKWDKLKKIVLHLNIYQRFLIHKGKYFAEHDVVDDSVVEFNMNSKWLTLKNSFGANLKRKSLNFADSRLKIGPFSGISFSLHYLYLANNTFAGDWLFQLRHQNSETINQLSLSQSWNIKQSVMLGYTCNIALGYNQLIEHNWFLKYHSTCKCWSMGINISYRPTMSFPDIFFNFEIF